MATVLGYSNSIFAAVTSLGMSTSTGPGLPVGGVEGFLDGNREVLDVLYQEVVLDAGARSCHRIALLERILADGMGRHLTGDDHRRIESM